MSKIVIFSHKPIFQKGLISGPGIRVFKIAKALQKKGHIVSIAELERKKKEIKEKINFILWNEDLLNNINKKYDVAFIQNWCSDPDFLNKLKCIPTIVDVYAPYLVEHIYYHYKQTNSAMNDFRDNVMLPYILPLLHGDFFICANKEQKDYYLGMLTMLGRINPSESHKDLIDIIPIIGSKQKTKREKIITKKIKKRIILWPGGFFPWFNPLTAIKAMELVNKEMKEVALVFVGSHNPLAPKALTYKYLKEIKTYVRKRKLENKSIFFLPWQKYDDFQNICNESEFAIISYKNNLETELSSRTRVIDCLSNNLPVISTKGDSVSEIIEQNKLGLTTLPNDIEGLAKKILFLLNNKNEINKFKKNITTFTKHNWNIDKLIQPIEQFCSEPTINKHKNKLTVYNIINEKEIQRKTLENEIVKKDSQIKEKDSQIKEKDSQIDSNNQTITNLFKIINEQKNILIKQKTIINKFRSSVVFPFYKLTSQIGKTKIGHLLQKILK